MQIKSESVNTKRIVYKIAKTKTPPAGLPAHTDAFASLEVWWAHCFLWNRMKAALILLKLQTHLNYVVEKHIHMSYVRHNTNYMKHIQIGYHNFMFVHCRIIQASTSDLEAETKKLTRKRINK